MRELPLNSIETTADDDDRREQDKSIDEAQKEASEEKVMVQKIDREEKARSARERYLARKRKEPSS